MMTSIYGDAEHKLFIEEEKFNSQEKRDCGKDIQFNITKWCICIIGNKEYQSYKNTKPSNIAYARAFPIAQIDEHISIREFFLHKPQSYKHPYYVPDKNNG